MSSRSRIELLPDKKFWATYLPLCRAIKNPSPQLEKDVQKELGLLDRTLRKAIDARWKETDAYYEFNDDWNVCWHHSMGVHSDQMCCGEFLDMVQRALARMKHDWCFHVALECDEDMGWGLQRAGRGQIVFYRGHIYGNRKDKFDYSLFNV
jgi:hypothetical protein